MQPPLTNGTLLQNRFRVVKILGQGGCGRTYLATDEQRFQEHCAIKEYFPMQGAASAVQKSRELFQREAEILYQIQHPQVPQFRALFEEADRFFFAQDFIAGKTYNQLWQERLAQGQGFTEVEVRALLDRLLPILTYLHDRHIIHRDISLDNIMLRDLDRLPVLIDFGVGKLELEQAQSPSPYGTVVGKSGYSPIEQLKTGRVSPSSDLYALAVSAIVLLTGKAPTDLFDEMTVNWRWRDFAPNTSHQFAKILDRMLSYRPQQRYQSAEEVLAQLDVINPQLQLIGAMAVRSKGELSPASPNLSPHHSARSAQQIVNLPVTNNAQTIQRHQVEIGDENNKRGVTNNAQTIRRHQPQPIASQVTNTYRRSHPHFGRWGIGITLLLGAIATISIGITWKQSPPSQSNLVAVPTNAIDRQLITPANNAPIEVSGQVGANGIGQYAIEGTPDRELSIRVISGAVRVHILHPDGRLPPGSPTISTAGNYFFPFAGKYLLDVKSTPATKFTLSVATRNYKSSNPQSSQNRTQINCNYPVVQTRINCN